ncbi:MAG: hypothetical protein E6G01_05995 [Actinobacteria bacterium]|nr:MAG: hypothetical protein E6G01_05995 [Actinomycetota bacterium]
MTDEGRGDDVKGPAFYAATRGGWREWWTVLHPPYTAWHLSYVVIGACLAPHVEVGRLVGTLLAFFLAVGVGAHALDELNGRPLRTHLPGPALLVAGVLGLAGAVVIGVVGITRVGIGLLPFIVVGALLVIGYNLELAGGRMHTDLGFAASWGAFPVLTAYFAQAGDLDVSAAVGAAGALGLSWAQRRLSTPARELRRQVTAIDGTMTFADSRVEPLTADRLLRPLEDALRALSWGVVAIAAGLALARLGP